MTWFRLPIFSHQNNLCNYAPFILCNRSRSCTTKKNTHVNAYMIARFAEHFSLITFFLLMRQIFMSAYLFNKGWDINLYLHCKSWYLHTLSIHSYHWEVSPIPFVSTSIKVLDLRNLATNNTKKKKKKVLSRVLKTLKIKSAPTINHTSPLIEYWL
jgi:hypothetical protein